MHYLVSHVNDAKSDKGIPTQWRGMEASFPMLVDWIADAQFQAGKAAEEKNAQAAANKQLPTADGMKIFLSGLAAQIRAGGYSERAFTSIRSEEHTSELQSLMRNSYAVFCLKKKNHITN